MNAEAKNPQHKIHWINFIRALCIIIIYFIHAEEFFGFTIRGFDKYLLPIYVNAFYFVSGYLMFKKHITIIEKKEYREERKRFLTNILFRLIIPSFIFSVLFFIPSFLIQNRQLSVLRFIEKTIGGNTYWFISSLVVAQMIFFLLFRTRIKNIWFYFLVSIGLYYIGYWCVAHEILLVPGFETNPWNFDKGLISTVFLAFGGLCDRRLADMSYIGEAHIRDCGTSVKTAFFLHLQDDMLHCILFVLVEREL